MALSESLLFIIVGIRSLRICPYLSVTNFDDIPQYNSNYYIIGRYIYEDNDKVFDMENNEFLDEHTPVIWSKPGNLFFEEHKYWPLYIGGKHHFRLQDGCWEEILLSDTYGWGDRYETFLINRLGEESATPESFLNGATRYYETYVSIIPVSETHYVAIDEQGAYIRTYEKGQSEEITIISAGN